jgi:hypothetical protein
MPNIIKAATPAKQTVRKSRLTDGDLVLLSKGSVKKQKGLLKKTKVSGLKPFTLSAGPIVDQEQSQRNYEAGYWTN